MSPSQRERERKAQQRNPPPTPKQLRYLAALDAQLGKERQRAPETRQGAHHAIDAAKAKLAALDRHRPAPLQKPTDTQLHDLAVLARRAGEPQPRPATRGEAARELARLRPT